MPAVKAKGLQKTSSGAVRTTVTLNGTVYQWGSELREQLGFRSYSDYVEFLIRLHKGAGAPALVFPTLSQ